MNKSRLKYEIYVTSDRCAIFSHIDSGVFLDLSKGLDTRGGA